MTVSIRDSSAALLLKGYAWLPDERRRSPDGVVVTRLMGQPAFGIAGPAAARWFYDERHVRRSGAVPGFVQSTLFGHGAVHTLDSLSHRHRKAMFLALFTDDRIADLVAHTGAAWDAAVPTWAGRPVSLFDESARVLADGVARWVGLPRDYELAHDCVAMVDGFATAGPRHWRARIARRRQEDRLAELVTGLRRQGGAGGDTAVDVVTHHRDDDGHLLSPRTAAVELLNIVRPTVAVSWFVAFTGHALHHWPAHRAALRDGDPAYARAFAHEVRRFYPFAPFVGGRAAPGGAEFAGHAIPEDALVLLDLYGQSHDPALWKDPYLFSPDRFLGPDAEAALEAFTFVPQGGGNPATGHRCPGEPNTVALLSDLAMRVARLDYAVPPQDLAIPLSRIPTRPRDGMLVTS
ncbi:cytochrome P450 [Asanoa sp. WMMD1127]|uniref:cytochrome P450 n=1 Tax=Asanoa sp. WMMD1127 TaxID=3016107 RepID=UPI002416A53A|nr:cytochrome P450 [Asanoa sp. WMMD1127]MDG4824844.1 cytochrome P450 [Asanoa sp. WMMD1127]